MDYEIVVGKVKISVEYRKDCKDYIAYLNGDRAKWDRGRTTSEAIGNVIITYKSEFA